MLAELLSVSAVTSLSVTPVLCPLFCGCVCCSQTEFEVRVGESAYWSLIEVPQVLEADSCLCMNAHLWQTPKGDHRSRQQTPLRWLCRCGHGDSISSRDQSSSRDAQEVTHRVTRQLNVLLVIQIYQIEEVTYTNSHLDAREGKAPLWYTVVVKEEYQLCQPHTDAPTLRSTQQNPLEDHTTHEVLITIREKRLQTHHG